MFYLIVGNGFVLLFLQLKKERFFGCSNFF